MNFEKAFEGKKTLVTGGLGFIGSNVARKLVSLGAEVTIVDAMIPKYGGNMFNISGIEKKVKLNIADVRDESTMNVLVRGQDYLFNIAGQVSHIDSITDPYTDLEINCKSQLTILEACKKNNTGVKIVYAGTRSQYGKADYLPVDEKHLIHPTDVNGINKASGERYHIVYNDLYGIRACSLRLTNTYGPRQMMKNSSQGFIAWFIRQAVDNETIKIFGNGKQLRDFNYADDVVDAFLMAAASEKANGEIYNIGSGKPVSVRGIAELLIETAGKGKLEMVPFPEDKKKIEIGDYYADYSKIKKALGW
ncbi:MAG: NAD-dependent epimerase/dehydratase family protein, partial [Candidatus ainarchaeum sp.]|nr:NAD-dependent epimerase/dehydratase family protein [Candidatus ainarchaeum sp.]